VSYPELEGYEPHGAKPVPTNRRRRLIQGAALLGIVLLVLPLFAAQAQIAQSSATGWCSGWVKYEVPEPSVAEARFEVFGPSFIGWECYATNLVGGDRYIGPLGIIPGQPSIRSGNPVNT